MNEFTKGQLQEIYRCIEHMSNDFNLVDKVDYMIENFEVEQGLKKVIKCYAGALDGLKDK